MLLRYKTYLKYEELLYFKFLFTFVILTSFLFILKNSISVVLLKFAIYAFLLILSYKSLHKKVYMIIFILAFWLLASGLKVVSFIRSDDLLFLFVFVYFIYIKLFKEKYKIKKSKFDPIILIYLFFYFISIIVGTYLYETDVFIVGFLNFLRLIELILFYRLIYELYQHSNKNLLLIQLYFVFIGLFVIFLDQLQLNYDIFNTIHWEGENFYGRFGTFQSSAEYGPFLLIVLAFLYNLIFYYKNRLIKILFTLKFIFVLYVLIGADSRSTLLSFLIVFVFFIIQKNKYLIIPILLTIPFFPYLAEISVSQKTASIIKLLSNLKFSEIYDYITTDHSLLVRFTNWPVLFDFWEKSPFFGNGPGFFNVIFDNLNLSLLAIDSAYFRVFVENGIVGFLIFVYMYFGFVSYINKNSKYFNNLYIEKYFLKSFVIFFIAISLNGLLIDILESVKTIIYMWIFLGISLKIIFSNQHNIQGIKNAK